MFQIWKKFNKSFPTHQQRSSKNYFLIKFSKQKRQNIPGVCVHHSLPHFLSQKSLPYLAFILVCTSVRVRALPWWFYILQGPDKCGVMAEMVAQGGEMTCPRLGTGAVTQVVSNNTFIPEKALKKRLTALHCCCCGEQHGPDSTEELQAAVSGQGCQQKLALVQLGEGEWIHVF